MNTDDEFEMEDFELPAEFEDEEELGRLRRSFTRSFSPRVNTPRTNARRVNTPRPTVSRPRPRPGLPRRLKYPPPIGGRRIYLYAPESPLASEYVRWVQTMLNQALNLQLPVDGVMSVETRSAIRSFQEKNGLPVTGIVGPDTERALIAAKDGQSSGPAATQPSEPVATAPEPGMTPPTEPASTSPAAEFDFEWETNDDEFEPEYEAAGSNVCPPFTPVALETPGGERIKKKMIPKISDLVVVQGAYAKTPLHRLAAEALKALVCAARADGIKHPQLLPTGSRSGFRDPKLQKAAWERALIKYRSEKEARKWVAKPGFSAHQSGRAIDFYLGLPNGSGNVAKLRQTPAYKWLAANAQRFGFYPYQTEPWHWEYNPPASKQSEILSEMEESFAYQSDFEDDEVFEFEQQNILPVPALLGTPDKNSQGETIYVKIGIGKGLPAATGIYIPNYFKPESDITVVIYLHGHKSTYPGNAVLIKGYWDGTRFPFFALREEVAASGRNMIFVAPSLGPTSQAGSLVKRGGFDTYIKQVLSGVNEHYMVPRHGRRISDVQSIIIAAHSGGGSPMLNIATGKDQYAMKIKECWCFDSMYGSVAPAWVRWSRSHPNRSLHVYYGPAKGHYDPKTGKKRVLPRDNAEAIASEIKRQRLTNACVQPSRARSVGSVNAHFWVPKVHLKERLLNSPCPAGNVGPNGRLPARSESGVSASAGVDWRAAKNKPLTLAKQEYEFEMEFEEEVNRNSRDYIKWVQQSLNRIMGLQLAVDGIVGPMTNSAIRSFQERQYGLKVDGIVGSNTEAALIRAGASAPPGSTGAPSASPGGGIPTTPSSVNTPLPVSGTGFYSYTSADKRFGTAATIKAVQAIATAWNQAHPSGPRLGIGNISRQGGGEFPPHSTHREGLNVDIRPVRSDRGESPVRYTDNLYSRSLTQELVNLIYANPVLGVSSILFNDTGIQRVKPYKGHDDHLHVTFIAGAPAVRPTPAPASDDLPAAWSNGPVIPPAWRPTMVRYDSITCGSREIPANLRPESVTQGWTARTQAIVNIIRGPLFGWKNVEGGATGTQTGHVSGSYHYCGRAIDSFAPGVRWNTRAAGAGLSASWRLANWAAHNAAALNVSEVIFYDHIWTVAKGGWRPYTNPDISKKPSYENALQHRDHVHISVY